MFFFSSRRRHTRSDRDWSSDVCSSDLVSLGEMRRVFNLGIGMIAIVARDDVESVAAAAARTGVETWIVGEVQAGATGVRGSEEGRGGEEGRTRGGPDH